MNDTLITPEVGMCWKRDDSPKVNKVTEVKENLMRFQIFDAASGLSTGEGGCLIRSWRAEVEANKIEIFAYPMFNTDSERFDALEQFLKLPKSMVYPPSSVMPKPVYWELHRMEEGELRIIRGKTLRSVADRVIKDNHIPKRERTQA